MTATNKLVFGRGNAKLSRNVATFSLPAGWTCPGARDCLAKVDPVSGKLRDGRETLFRCFSASQEAFYPSVRVARNSNLEALRACRTSAAMAQLLLSNLPNKIDTVRIHVSGDFYSQAYFDAWVEVARARPGLLIYGYTKSLPYWVARLDSMPANLVLTASKGGKHDNLIGTYHLRYAQVVFSEQEAAERGLELDHDDSHAMRPGPSFALLLHGMQPPKSAASKALQTLRNAGEFGYGEKAAARRKALTMVS